MYLVLKYVTQADTTFLQTAVTGFLVFLPGDILKCLAAAYLGKRLIPIVKKEKHRKNEVSTHG